MEGRKKMTFNNLDKDVIDEDAASDLCELLV